MTQGVKGRCFAGIATGLVEPNPKCQGEEAGVSNQRGGHAVKADLAPAEKFRLVAVGNGKPLETFFKFLPF